MSDYPMKRSEVMTVRIAVALYRWEVAGTPTGDVDVQVRHFDDPAQDIESYLESEPARSCPNDQGEPGGWAFVRVIAIENLRTHKSDPETERLRAAYEHFPPVRVMTSDNRWEP